jgi:hypothetical protein
MKKSLFAILLGLVLASVMAFSSCSFEFGGNGTETSDYTADDKEGSVELFDMFFENTFKSENCVVTVKDTDGNVQMTENVVGTSHKTVFKSTATTTYAFVDGERYIYAMDMGEDMRSYYVGKDWYDMGCYNYLEMFAMFKDLPEEGVTFACSLHEEGTFGENEEDNTSTGTFELNITSANGTMKLTATAENGYVTTASLAVDDVDGKYTINVSYEYGNASLTLPDITDWYENVEGEEDIDESVNEDENN